MMSTSILLASLTAGLFTLVCANPSPFGLGRRTDPDNTVVVNSEDNYCLVVPKDAHTDIGDSEYPGGTTVYCSPAAHFSPSQGVIPGDFWANVEYKTGEGSGRINADDAGGQYDSSGGSSGTGNPVGSVCIGYNHYVELLEPAGPRACIRCCENADDCPTTSDRSGCPNVIQGNYFGCG